MIGRTSSNRWMSRVPRVGYTTLVCALTLDLLNESPVWGEGRVVAASKSANATNGGALLLAMGVGVLVLGGGGFTILTWSRRKRAPQQCALEREALEVAEQAVRYWEGALAHLQHTTQSHDGSVIDNGGAGGPSRETQASLLEKATAGHANALQVRDERQLDLIQCMASGAATTPLSKPDISKLEPRTFDAELSTPPPTTFE